MSRREHKARETWLQEAVRLLDKSFFAHLEPRHRLPAKLQVACSFPVGSPMKIIGQAFQPTASKDEITTNVIVSPVLDEPFKVLDTLLHELVHAALFAEHPNHKHGREFIELGRIVGLQKPWRSASIVPASETHNKVLEMADRLGPYPHSAIVPRQKRRAAAGGWIRLVSVNDESYKVVISPKVFAEHGAPSDPWGDPMTEAT